MITTKELDKLQSFGKEDDGSYSDRDRFVIIPIKRTFRTTWNLYSF